MQQVGALFPLKWICQGFRSALLPDTLLPAEPAHSWEHGRIALVLAGLGCSRLRPVPDDLPLETAQRRMNVEDAWDVGFGRWETYFGLVLVSTVIYVRAEDGSWPKGAAAAVLLAAMVPWYLLLGRRTISRRNSTAMACVYVGGLIALSSGATFAAPASALALFALCPQCFMIAGWRVASVGIVLLNVAPASQFLLDGPDVGSIIAFMVWTVVTMAFSVLFGFWIDRIIAQSSERRDLIQRLEATRAELADR